jgi:hypothetical protein
MQTLRFAIVCNGRTLPAWQAQAVSDLCDGGARLVAVLASETPAAHDRDALLWRAFSRICRPRALRPVAVPEPNVDGTSGEFDFLLAFSSGVSKELSRAARFGVWAFRFGNNAGTSPCFAEMCGREATVSATLERLTELTDSSTVLRDGYLKTVDYSYARSVDQLCFQAAKWPSYVASEIAANLTQRVDRAPVTHAARKERKPSNAATVRFALMLAANAARRAVTRNISEEWNIGAVKVTPEELLTGVPIRNVRWLSETPGRWAADPMALGSAGTLAVLCEEMNVGLGKARISATSFDGTAWSAVSPVIETSTHASYPYLFERGGEIYCVPETFEAGEVALYRAREFPNKWDRVATLIDGVAAIDGTLFEHEGRIWFFCTTTENSNAVLLAFHAPEITGPWKPHAGNPIKIDVRGARPAGAPFRVEGRLYRPAQDSSKTYGGRVVIHRVFTLTETEFYEEPFAYVEPDPKAPYGAGLHTLSFAGDYCIIDGKRHVWRPKAKLPGVSPLGTSDRSLVR